MKILLPLISLALTFTVRAQTSIPDPKIWIYDDETSRVYKNKELNPDTITPLKLITFINKHHSWKNRILLEFIKVSQDTIFVRIRESRFLTQQTGSTGAEEYMETTTFTLTELKGIRYVNFDFEEGDHTSPGTYSRHYYEREKKGEQKTAPKRN